MAGLPALMEQEVHAGSTWSGGHLELTWGNLWLVGHLSEGSCQDERQGFPASFIAFSMSLFIFYFLFKFCFLNLTSAADVKERLSSIPLFHGNVQLFPCRQPPTNSFAFKLLESLFGRRQGAVALPGLGGPLLATPGPCACHTHPAAAPTKPRPCASGGSSSQHTWEIKQGVPFLCFGLNRMPPCFM